MDPFNASDELKRRLQGDGVALARGRDGFWHGSGVDARAAWEAFKQLAQESPSTPVIRDGEHHTISDGSDRLLYEAGLREARKDKPARYDISVDRQWTLTDADGQYAGMHHVMLSFHAPADPDLAELPYVQEWGDAGSPAAADPWIAMVEASAPFNRALDHRLVDQFTLFSSDI